MAMITGLDRAFGWLMQALKERGVEDHSIVVFTSDHGDALGSHGNMHNKMRPEQESIRVPLLVRYPDRLKPRVSDLLVGTLDLMPTLLGMMRLPIPKSCDGRNLSRFIAEGKDGAVDAVPIFLPSRDFRGVYTDRYTYCYDSAVGGDFEYRDSKHPPRHFAWNVLYNRDVDPYEKRNLYDDPAYREIREQLHAKTLAWMKDVGDEGWSYQDIIDTSFTPEDQKRQRAGGRNRSGILLGSPMELLK
jgi:arylsulfatase A-like enzyme